MMDIRLTHLLGILLMAAAFACAVAKGSLPARAQDDASIDQFVAFLDQSVRAIHAQTGTTDEAIRAGCRDLMARILDLEAMARDAAGESWDAMTQTQRAGYLSAFERRLLSDCVGPIRDYKGEPIALAGVRTVDGSERLVAIRFGPQDGAGRIITWRLHGAAPNNLRVIDIIVDGRSTVANLRSEFSAVLQSQNGNIDLLIEFLRR